jgi:UDP-2,3-diacylglucosamine pyrophosphatase LpxH
MPPAAAKVGHPEILSALQETFPSGVFLLARLADTSLLPGSDLAPQVFIPDTHIVPASDVKQWPGHVLTPSRFDSLARLLDALDRLRQADPSLVVWQLGDLVDLWRVGKSDNASIDRRLDRVRGDWGPLLRRFDPEGKGPIKRLFGNHDEGLSGRPGIVEREFVPPDPGDTASNDMLVIHGHQFDPVEDLPGFLKASIMRGFTQRVSTYTRDLVLSANPHWSPLPPDYSFSAPPHPRPEEREKFLCADLRPETPVPLGAAAWNVREVKLTFHPEANPFETEINRGAKWQDDRHPALWDRAKQRAKEASGSGYSVALVVVGHTHNPRIVLGRYPDGERIAMMDCGGWIGPRYLAPGIDGPIHNCSIAVRVGADLRIYQLGKEAYDWPK